MMLCFTWSVAFSQYAIIRGKVLDKATLKGIEYANVFIDKQVSILTDSSGRFQLKINKNKSDSLHISALGYFSVSIAINDLKDENTFYLKSDEIIKEIEVKSKKLRTFSRKIGNFKRGSDFPFRNVHFWYKSATLHLSFIPNKYQKEGFIEKVFFHASSSSNVFLIDPSTKKKVYYKNPEWIKIRVRCIQASSGYTPDKDIVSTNMIFKIKNYKSQWIDISNYNVPFPKNGAFVGIEVLELKGRENWGWGDVSFPIFKHSKNAVPDYVHTGNNKFISMKGFFNFGAEVSFVKE